MTVTVTGSHLVRFHYELKATKVLSEFVIEKKWMWKGLRSFFVGSQTCALTCVLLCKWGRTQTSLLSSSPTPALIRKQYEPPQCQQRSAALVSHLSNQIHGQTSGGLKLIVFRRDKSGPDWKRHFSLTAPPPPPSQLHPHSSVSNCKTNDNLICESQRLHFSAMRLT